MMPGKYAELGFEITKFGANSKALKYAQKPIFIFSQNSNIDIEFVKRICDTYLVIAEKHKNLTCVRTP